MGRGYWLTCRGGPFDGYSVNYPDLPNVIVLMDTPFHYHDYRRQGDSFSYCYVERQS